MPAIFTQGANMPANRAPVTARSVAASDVSVAVVAVSGASR
jgi:hypothetical protein